MFRSTAVLILCIAMLMSLLILPGDVSSRTTSNISCDDCCPESGSLPQLAMLDSLSHQLSIPSSEEQAKLMFAQSSCSPLAPLDLSGPPADVDEVREAIVEGVKYILQLQQENGSWDVQLSGSFLSNTADEAMDAVLVTALCCLALQPHQAVDPKRISKSLERATEFICDRVERGKLPKDIYYSVWRYAWSLKFLNYQHNETTDENLKERIRIVADKMIDTLFDIQLVGSGMSADQRKYMELLKRRKNKLPSIVGITLTDPTADSPKPGTGAIIEAIDPDGSAAKSDLKVGDQILAIKKKDLKSRFEYYDLQLEYLSGDKVNFEVMRGAEELTIQVKMIHTWPGYIGITGQEGPDGTGYEVTGFLLRSPFKNILKVGDLIISINKEEILTQEQFVNISNHTLAGDKIKLKYIRSGSKKSLSKSLPPSPGGALGILIDPEDKGDADGVPVSAVRKDSPADKIGIITGDRVTRIDGKDVKGLDQYINLQSTLPAGKVVKVHVLKGGTREEEYDVLLGYLYMPANLGIEPRANAQWSDPIIIGKCIRGGAAERSGLKAGDTIISINEKTITKWQAFSNILSEFHAWQEVTVNIERRGDKHKVPLTMGEVDMEASGPSEEGGWAYYPDMGISASFCTSTVIIVLDEVRRDMQLPFNKFRMRRLAMSANLLQDLHVAKGNFKYHKFASADLLGSMGRNAVCEIALVLAGRESKGDLSKVLQIWVKHREEIDRVREFEGTHCYDHFANAAYYWLFSHYYIMVGSNMLGKGVAKKMSHTVVKALMLTREDDGTWLMSHKAFGPLVGTTLAMMTLGECPGEFREGYPEPEDTVSEE